MVLSNKKLKQKLRANLAESLVQSEIQNNSTNSVIQHSLKSLLDSAIHKPRLSKREKRRENNDGDSPAPNDTTGRAEAGVQIRPEEEKVKKSNKKRKRDADANGDSEKLKPKTAPNDTSGGAEAGVQIGQEEEKVKKSNKKRKSADENGDSEKLKPKNTTKKKKKKQKKNNKQKNKVSDGGEVEHIIKSEVEVRAEQSVAETIKNNYSEEKTELSTRVYVGGIPYYSTEDDIRSFFESCGSITNIDCMLFPDSGKFRGIAIISFKTEAAANRALELDGADMGGLFLKIQLYKATREHKPSDFSPAIIDGYNRIYIGNLSWDITEDEIRSFFSDVSISSIRLGQDKETKEFKGFAHVDFADSLSVTMALKLDQKILRGRPARIRCAVPKKAIAPASTSATPAGREVEVKHVEMSEKNDYAGFSEKNNYAEMSENVDNGVVSGKIRRRTCYECGEKGHVSSDCPKKPAAVVIDSGRHFEETSEYPVEVSEKADSVASGKIRRRTCYECGEKGHLSSDCPKKAGEVIDSGELNYGEKLSEKPAVVETSEKFDNGVGGSGGGGGAVSVPSGKIRRRTCYECGEKGHLSSACPKKTWV